MNKKYLVAALIGVASINCTENTETSLNEAAGQALIAPSLATYVVGDTVTVTFDGMRGAPSDWIAVALVGDADNVWKRYAFTGGAGVGSSRGTLSFAGLPVGVYEARAFYDWLGTSSLTVQQRSAPFAIVTASGARITSDRTSYIQTEPIRITFSGVPQPSASDWVGLAPQGAPAGEFVAWASSGGQSAGEVTFWIRLQTGRHVARLFRNGSMEPATESPPFDVTGSTVTLATDSPTYVQGAPIRVDYFGIPSPSATDWIAIAAEGSPATAFLQWFYTGGASSGTLPFTTVLAPGRYVVRLHRHNGFGIAEESAPFEVTRKRHTLTLNFFDDPNCTPISQATVVSTPAGLACTYPDRTLCTTVLEEGTRVTLTGSEGYKTQFMGFRGACTSETLSCAFDLHADAQVTASLCGLIP